jgi:hypothetical protein
MLKKAILWPLGLTIFVFTFVEAAAISKVTSEEWDNGILHNVVTRCGGINPLRWFADGCSDLMLIHLAPLVLGLGVLGLCIYFAQRNRSRAATRFLALDRSETGFFPRR